MKVNITLNLDAVVMAPHDVLILTTPDEISHDDVRRIMDALPDTLEGRVLFVTSATATVVKGQ